MEPWNIKGKAADLPVHRLLGTAEIKPVPCYAPGFYAPAEGEDLPTLPPEAEAHIEAGFKAVKVKVGYGLYRVLNVSAQSGKPLGMMCF